MTLRKGLPSKKGATDANDTRYDFRNLVVCNADGSPRGGVTSPVGVPLVSATATMNTTVAAFSAVAVRDGGVVLLSNDGPVNVLHDAAPTANSRIDVVYAKQNDSSSTVTTPDADDNAIIAIAKGVAQASPQKPSIPVGAVELATVQIPAGATATNSGNPSVIITQTAQFTAAPGGSVPFRTVQDLNGWTTAAPRQRASVIADPTATYNAEYLWNGTAWLQAQPRTGVITATTDASGLLNGNVHGLPTTPSAIILTPYFTDDVNNRSAIAKPTVGAVTSTTFQVVVYRTDSSARLAGTGVKFSWVAYA